MPDPPIRILLADMPHLLCDLVERAFRSEPDMRVVGVAAKTEELAAAAHDHAPDYVIVGLDGGDLPAAAAALLRENARPRLLGIAPRDGHVELYELRPERTRLGARTLPQLVETVRATGAQ